MDLQNEWLENIKLRAEGDKLYAKGRKLYAKGGKLYAEGKIIFLSAVIKQYGNCKIEWVYCAGNYDCKLENGDVYLWDIK